MIGSIRAELLVLSKRAATWVLLGIWVALATFFGYILPYITWRNGDATERTARDLNDMLPANLVGNMLGGFPFFGGVLILILGVLAFGAEYGWGTWKTLFTQKPGRIKVFGAKLIALGIWIIPFVLGSFLAAAIASPIIANVENAAVTWPDAWLIVRGIVAGWLIMAVWASFGVLLGILSRGTALAIGLGILYGLVIEGLISALFDQVSFLKPVIDFLLRANAYSLVEVLGASQDQARGNGPGAFSGPYVGGSQAAIVLVIELALFLGIAAWSLRQRDVT
jgi:ABC-type transport system involved in multi-copper enzyme maturation permease subunit